MEDGGDEGVRGAEVGVERGRLAMDFARGGVPEEARCAVTEEDRNAAGGDRFTAAGNSPGTRGGGIGLTGGGISSEGEGSSESSKQSVTDQEFPVTFCRIFFLFILLEN